MAVLRPQVLAHPFCRLTSSLGLNLSPWDKDTSPSGNVPKFKP